MSGIALADAVDQGPDLIRDLLILEARGATGQLEVISAGVHTLLYFVDGQLVYAEGGSQTDTLGRLLVRSGSLSREQYSAVLQGMTDAFVEHEEPTAQVPPVASSAAVFSGKRGHIEPVLIGRKGVLRAC